MMMMQALLLTIFIASFRKQSGRRMRKYGLVQPTDKQSGSYDDHQDFDPFFHEFSFLIHSPPPSMVKGVNKS